MLAHLNRPRLLAGSALAVFIALQVLGWTGYQAPPDGAVQFTQSPAALLSIRLLTGPLIILFLAGAAVVTWFYPLTREKQEQIRQSLRQRRSQLPEEPR